MKKLFAAAFLALTLTTTMGAAPVLQGCASLGLYKPEGFSQNLAAGYQSITTSANLIGAALDAGKLKPADARNAHTTLTDLKGGLDIAKDLHVTDAEAGEARLKATLAALDALELYLKGNQ